MPTSKKFDQRRFKSCFAFPREIKRKLINFNKILIAVISCIVIVAPGSALALATGIEILSSNYHIWGNVAGVLKTSSNDELITTEYLAEEYNIISSTPISESLYLTIPVIPFGHELVGYASSEAGMFYANADSGSYAESWRSEEGGEVYEHDYFPTQHSPLIDPNLYTGNDALAEASWVFRTLGSHMSISWTAGGDSYGYARLWLTDLTDSHELLFKNFPADDVYGDMEFRVDPTHEYSLRMYVEAESMEDSQIAYVNALVRVPETSTMLLLGTGLIGLLGWGRRKFKK